MTAKIETLNTGHSQEITSIRIDPRNDLMVSSGWDSLIMVQKMQGVNRLVNKVLMTEDSPNIKEGDQEFGDSLRYRAEVSKMKESQ